MSYTPPKIPLNIAVANPGLPDVLSSLKTNIQLSINCHAIATIQSFNPSNSVSGYPTVEATINYNKTYFEKQADGTYATRLVDYPVLVDVPVIVLGGGATTLTFPIKKGDQCLILFNDRDFNNWFAGATTGPVPTPRLHSMADGLALVGFSKIDSYDEDHALLSNGIAKVGIPTSPAGTQVLIGNDLTTLGSTLGTLIMALETFSTGLNVGSLSGQAAALAAALVPIQTQIMSLLE